MGKSSDIEWTHHTFNPWWGCTRVSPGCERCYAEAFAKRTGHKVWGVQADRRFFGDKHWNEPRAWDLAAANACTRHRVFCASMADVFEDRAELIPHRHRLFDLIDETPSLDWLLLTKRPENVMQLVPEDWRDGFPESVWLGTTAEDQKRADERIPLLLECPAVVRFVSAEPLLGPLNLRRWIGLECTHEDANVEADTNAVICRECDNAAHLSWIIVGGESGPGARPCRDEWIASVVEQCAEANAACFVKQMGAHVIQGGIRRKKADAKGGNIDEFPHDLRVRQFPTVNP